MALEKNMAASISAWAGTGPSLPFPHGVEQQISQWKNPQKTTLFAVEAQARAACAAEDRSERNGSESWWTQCLA